MKKNKKIVVINITLLFFITILFALVQIFYNIAFRKNGIFSVAGVNDFTLPSAPEEQAVEQKILADWGTPTKVELLSANTPSINTSEDGWYYLNSDFILNDTTPLVIAKNKHIRILLNGYTISNNILFQLNEANSKLSFFDKIPNQTGVEYQYNTSPEKYFTYSSADDSYKPFNGIPTGEDVTNLPTFTQNTYIKVSGSGILPTLTHSANFMISTTQNTVLNVYGISCVGIEVNTNFSSLDIDGEGNFYICNFLGNKLKNTPAFLYANTNSTIRIDHCKIYGNKFSNKIGALSQIDYKDIGMSTQTKINTFKSNLGVIFTADKQNITTYENYLSLYTVNFQTRQNDFSIASLERIVNASTTIEGTIEVFYNLSLNYTADNANLSFRIHGEIPSVANIGQNSFSVASGAVLAKLQLLNQAPTCTVNGKVDDLESTGEVNIGTSGIATILKNKTVATLRNQGRLNLSGIVSNLVENTGTFSILQDTQFEVANGVTLEGNVINYGDLTVNGTIHALSGNGYVRVSATGKITVPQGTTLASVSNAGNVVVAGRVDALLENTKTIEIQSTGNVTIAQNANIEGCIDNAGELTVNGTVQQIYNTNTCTVQAGTIQWISNTANLTVLAGANITEVQNEGTLINTGTIKTINSTNGTITAKTNAIIESLQLLDGQLIVEDRAEVGVSVFGENARTTNNGKLYFKGIQAKRTTIDNQATFILNAGASFQMQDSASLNNSASIQILKDATLSIAQGCTLKGNIENAGTFNISGEVVSIAQNSGQISITDSGKLTIPIAVQVGGSISNDGQCIVNGTVNTNMINSRNGSVVVYGVVQSIENAGTCTFEQDSNAENITNTNTLIFKGLSTSITNRENATAEILGSVQSVIQNYGTVKIPASGIVATLQNFGNATASVQGKILNLIENLGNLTFEGTTNELQNLQDATLWIQKNATLQKLVNYAAKRVNIENATIRMLENYGDVQCKGDVTTVINEGTLIIETISKDIESVTNNKSAELTIIGNVSTVVNNGILKIETKGKDIKKVTNTQDAELNITGNVTTQIENSGKLTVNGNITTIQNNGTFNLKGNASSIESNGELTINGIANSILIQGGKATLQSGSVQEVVNAKGATLVVEKNLVVDKIENQGICNLFGEANTVNSSGEITIVGKINTLGTILDGKATLQAGAILQELVAQSKKSGGKQKNVKEEATVNINNGVIVQKLIAQCRLDIASGATVTLLEVQNNPNGATSYTDIKDDANVETAKLMGDAATLEIQQNAKIGKLEYQKDIGTLIDHRIVALPPVDNQNISNTKLVVLICVIVGGIILLIAILLVIIILINKRRNMQSLKNISVQNGQFVVNGGKSTATPLRTNMQTAPKQRTAQADILAKIANLGNKNATNTTPNTPTVATPTPQPLPQLRTFKANANATPKSNTVATNLPKEKMPTAKITPPVQPKPVTQVPNLPTLKTFKKENSVKTVQPQTTKDSVSTKSAQQLALEKLRVFPHKDKK